MKSIRNLIIIVYVIITSCNSFNETYFDNFIGTWTPIKMKDYYPVIEKIQIERRNNFYLIAAKYSDSEAIRFLIGKPSKDHLLVDVSSEEKEGRPTINDVLIDRPPEIYYDPELKCLFIANTVFEFSHDNIFNISNLPIDGKKRLQFVK